MSLATSTSSPILKIAQFSDCHLFADIDAHHYGANVYANLVAVLTHIAQQDDIDLAVFTGDLSQDHSAQSYQRFVEAIKSAGLTKPVYFLNGNHDDKVMLQEYLVGAPFQQAKSFSQKGWQVLLVDSQSASPAGFVDNAELARISTHNGLPILVFMHHHAIEVNYFIDRHGLKNQDEFWQAVNHNNKIKLICCGHVHRGISVTKTLDKRQVELLTCPATSIEFAKHPSELQATKQSAGYRIIELTENAQYASHCVYL